MPMETSTITPVANAPAATAPLAGAYPVGQSAPKPPVAAAPDKITGEARLNAILKILQEKHGFHFPEHSNAKFRLAVEKLLGRRKVAW